jgi:hypothetical protein
MPVLLSTLVLSGCAIGHRLYAPPQSAEVAHLRVTDQRGRGLTAHEGMIATFEHAETCKGRYWMQGGPSLMKQTEVTTSFARIPAGKPFSFAIHHPMGGSSFAGYKNCIPILNFTPEQGRYYLAVLSTGPEACYVALSSAGDPSMAGSRREPFRRMLFSNGFDEDSSFCSPAE